MVFVMVSWFVGFRIAWFRFGLLLFACHCLVVLRVVLFCIGMHGFGFRLAYFVAVVFVMLRVVLRGFPVHGVCLTLFASPCLV